MQTKILSGLRTTFWAHLVVGLIFGIGYLLIPETVMGVFGMQVQDPWPYRLVGAAILGFTATSWFALRETEWDRVKIVVEGEVVWTLLATIVYALVIVANGYPFTAWIGPLLMLAFFLAFGYFYLQEGAVRTAPLAR